MAMSRSLGGRSLTIRSPIWISPAVISSRPATIRSVVVLPQPDGPTKTMNSLSRIVRFTSLTACTSSYFLFRSLSTTCAISDLAGAPWNDRPRARRRRPGLHRAMVPHPGLPEQPPGEPERDVGKDHHQEQGDDLDDHEVGHAPVD